MTGMHIDQARDTRAYGPRWFVIDFTVAEFGRASGHHQEAEGEQISVGRYPVVDVAQAWEIWSMLGILAPDIEHHYHQDHDGRRTARMLHPDGS
ncbi:MAG: hypothetical protein ACRDRI_21375 [Pseudonocardiaceae bacterium]